MSDRIKDRTDETFKWWMGVVEDNYDPTGLDRLRVRVFGYHSPNLSEMPTSTLPWAMMLNAPNASKMTSKPLRGDYVMGFFADGESAQQPIVMGVLNGIPQKEDPENQGFSSKAVFSDIKLKDTVVLPKDLASEPALKVLQSTTSGSTIATTTVPGAKLREPGQATTPRLSHNYQDSIIKTMDDFRTHVCDVKNNVKFQEALQKLQKYIDFQAIRAAIEAVTDGVSASPLATQVVQAIKIIRSYIRMINEFLEFVNDVILVISEYIAYVRQMIQYILSLPAQLAYLFAQCLAELYSALSNALNFSVSSSVGSELISETRGLISDVLTTTQNTQATYSLAQATVEDVKLLVDPKTYSRI